MVFEKIRSILSEQLNIKESEINPESSFTIDLEMDSLDFADLFIRIESAFDIDLSRNMLKDVKTVGDLSMLLEEKKRYRS